MQILEADRRVFETAFAGADSFLRAARLRYELFCLLRKRNASLSVKFTDDRIDELRRTPACKEPWFVMKLEGEGLLESERK